MLLCSFHLIPEGFTSGENTSKVVYTRSHRFGSIEEHEARRVSLFSRGNSNPPATYFLIIHQHLLPETRQDIQQMKLSPLHCIKFPSRQSSDSAAFLIGTEKTD